MHRLSTITFPYAEHSVLMCSFSIRTIFPIKKTVACCNWRSIRIQRHFSNWTQRRLNRIRPSNNIRHNSADVYLCTNYQNSMRAITVTSIVCSNVNCERLWIYAVAHRSFCRTIFPMEQRPTLNARSYTTNAWNVMQVSIRTNTENCEREL